MPNSVGNSNLHALRSAPSSRAAMHSANSPATSRSMPDPASSAAITPPVLSAKTTRQGSIDFKRSAMLVRLPVRSAGALRSVNRQAISGVAFGMVGRSSSIPRNLSTRTTECRRRSGFFPGNFVDSSDRATIRRRTGCADATPRLVSRCSRFARSKKSGQRSRLSVGLSRKGAQSQRKGTQIRPASSCDAH